MTAPMATIPADPPIRYPISQSVPHSPQAQRAVFWSGIVLTTLLLASVVDKLLNPAHNREIAFLMLQLVCAVSMYSVYFWLQISWNTKIDDLKSQPLLEIPLSNSDPNVANRGIMKFVFWLSQIFVLLSILTGLLSRSPNLPLPMLAMLPMFATSFCGNQPARLRILPTGLVWQLPTATIYYPWHLIESVEFAPGVTLDFLRWTAPTRWAKSFRFETKLSKLSDPDRERLQQLLAQYLPTTLGNSP